MSIQATLDTIKQVQPALSYLENYARGAAATLGVELSEGIRLTAFTISAGVTNSKVTLEYLDTKWESLPEEMAKHPEDEVDHALERVFLHANTAIHTADLIELFASTCVIGHTFLNEDKEWNIVHHNAVSDGLDFLHTLVDQESQRITTTKNMAAMVEGMPESDLQEAASGDYDRFMAMLEKRAGL